jgi:hypothetical protein
MWDDAADDGPQNKKQRWWWVVACLLCLGYSFLVELDDFPPNPVTNTYVQK